MRCWSESSVAELNTEMKAPNGLGKVVSSAQSAAVVICIVAHTICAEGRIFSLRLQASEQASAP